MTTEMNKQARVPAITTMLRKATEVMMEVKNPLKILKIHPDQKMSPVRKKKERVEIVAATVMKLKTVEIELIFKSTF